MGHFMALFARDENSPAKMLIAEHEGQPLAMELLMQRALEDGLEATVLDSASYRRYLERRQREGHGG